METKNHEIVDFRDLDISNITFAEVRKNKYGGKMINIRYNHKIRYIAFPPLSCPFSIAPSYDFSIAPSYDFGKEEKYHNGKRINGFGLSVSFRRDYKEDSVYQKMKEFDDFLNSACWDNRQEWGVDNRQDLWKGLIK